jgi:hypothetical protein
MASSGPRSPGTVTESLHSGNIYYWSYVNNIFTENNIDAFVQLSITCFLRGTIISCLLENKRIEELNKGDILISYDRQKNKKENNKIIDILESYSNSYYILKTKNRKVRVTGEHPFLTDKGFMFIKDLKINMNLVTETGIEKIIDKKIINKRVKVYNLKVGYPNTFFANGFCVHNKPI